ncbi:hypothetical protein [Actinomadura monticuli]|uniref:WXG100 family type VII secretion target n=1 Tax=Actinomadura monticuli TaxID=3097367 RepID=A0ABV4QDW0_9ACTN
MTLKIDARAVHAELQAISTAMSEVTRQMGPQTWQGGSAAGFTSDLQAHNRALNRLMLEVERTVVRFNQVPLTLDPPEIPRATPPAGKPGVASVSPSALERLETALTRAAADLPHRAKMIRGHLALAHPDIPSTTSCDNAAAWCRTQATRMRTRIMYALAETEVTATPLIQGPVIQVPDVERFGSKEMTDLARLQARAWQKHTTHPGNATPALMSEIARTLAENSKNTTYLATFFSNIPPGSAGKLPYRLHQLSNTSGLTPEDKKTVGNLGTALAALSRKKETEGITAEALGPAGADMPGQALLVKLSAPNIKWSSAILADLGRAALRWRQKHPSYEITHTYDEGDRGRTKVLNQPYGLWWKAWGISGPSGKYPDAKTLREYDPALAVLGRISGQKDLTAARNLASMKLDDAFLIEDPDRAPAVTWLTRGTGDTYASLIVAPDWPDGGTVAGSVIQLATTPEKSHENQAALNAAEVMKSVGWWNDKGREKAEKPLKSGAPLDLIPWFDILPRMDQAPPGTAHSEHYTLELGPGLTSGLLAMTRMYLPALGQANRTSSGTGLTTEDPVTRRTFAEIGGEDMQQFLRTFAADDRAWAQIAVDTEAYRQGLFAWGIKHHNLNDAIVKAGYLEGVLIAAFGKERITREELTKKQYEEAQKHLGLLRDVGGAALGASPVAATPGATDAYAIGTALALDKVKYADFDKKVQELRGTYATYSDQLYRDLAIGLHLAKGSRTGDPEMDKLLLTARSSGYRGPEIVRGIQYYDFAEPGAVERRTGFAVIGDVQLQVEHNAPEQ